MQNQNPIIVESGGQRFRIDGALSQLVKEHIQMQSGAQDGLENETFEGTTIYAVAINLATQEDVDQFNAMAGSVQDLYLLAVNPGKAQRTECMDQIQRKAESLDIPIHSDTSFLLDSLISNEVRHQIVGPLAATIEKALQNQSDARGASEEAEGLDDDIEAEDIEPGMESWSKAWLAIWSRKPEDSDEAVEQWAKDHINASGKLTKKYELTESARCSGNAFVQLGVTSAAEAVAFANHAFSDLEIYQSIVKDGVVENRSVLADIGRANKALAALKKDGVVEEEAVAAKLAEVLETLKPAYFTVFQEPKGLDLLPTRHFGGAPTFVKHKGLKLVIKGKMPFARTVGFQIDEKASGSAKFELTTKPEDIDQWLKVRKAALRLVNEVDLQFAKLDYLDQTLVSPELLTRLEKNPVSEPYFSSLTDPWLLVKYMGFLPIVGERARRIANVATRLIRDAVTFDN